MSETLEVAGHRGRGLMGVALLAGDGKVRAAGCSSHSGWRWR